MKWRYSLRILVSHLGISTSPQDAKSITCSEPEDASDVLERIERLSGPSARLHLAFEEVLRTISLARVMGVARPIVFRPFTMLDQPHFRDGVQFEVRGAKRTAEAIARGGR